MLQLTLKLLIVAALILIVTAEKSGLRATSSATAVKEPEEIVIKTNGEFKTGTKGTGTTLKKTTKKTTKGGGQCQINAECPTGFVCECSTTKKSTKGGTGGTGHGTAYSKGSYDYSHSYMDPLVCRCVERECDCCELCTPCDCCDECGESCGKYM